MFGVLFFWKLPPDGDFKRDFRFSGNGDCVFALLIGINSLAGSVEKFNLKRNVLPWRCAVIFDFAKNSDGVASFGFAEHEMTFGDSNLIFKGFEAFSFVKQF